MHICVTYYDEDCDGMKFMQSELGKIQEANFVVWRCVERILCKLTERKPKQQEQI